MIEDLDLPSVNEQTSEHIEATGLRSHTKASEQYVDVSFRYPEAGSEWTGSVPIHYRRTGLFCHTVEDVVETLEGAYDEMHPRKREQWLKEQEEYWNTQKSRAKTTRGFFEELKDAEWTCQNCELPDNPNWARRTQDLKEFGYTIATETGRRCADCGQNATHLIMLRIPRGGVMGYETWSGELRERILNVLGHYDPYEDSVRRGSLLPDHKFPEIRWDEATKEENPEDMSDEEIRGKFQLLSNQRNQQKREVCRHCFQTGQRGKPFGVAFFYEGGSTWPDDVPQTGKDAEEGCHGCGWYDMDRWRQELNEFIEENS